MMVTGPKRDHDNVEMRFAKAATIHNVLNLGHRQLVDADRPAILIAITRGDDCIGAILRQDEAANARIGRSSRYAQVDRIAIVI